MNKPKVKLTGLNGNTMVLLAACSSALKKSGMANEAKELQEKVFASKSYDESLSHMMHYCEVS